MLVSTFDACVCVLCVPTSANIYFYHITLIFFFIIIIRVRSFAHIFPLAEKNEAAILIKKKKDIKN